MSKRVWQYPEVTSITADDYLLLDNETDGSKSILASKVGAILINKVVTERKVYKASEETGVVNGYKEVSVEVPYTTITDLEGDIVTFDDGEDFPMPSLKVGIEPIQEGSGDPSPTNVRPISGHTEANVSVVGKNLWGGEKLADDIVAKVPNATKDTTNKTVSYSASNVRNVVLFDKFKPNTQYSVTNYMSSGVANLAIVYSDDTTTSVLTNDITVSTPNKTVVSLIGEWQTGSSVLLYEQFGVFEGVLTASDFVAYNGQTYTIQLGDTYYGGKLDVVSGVLTVLGKGVDLGSLSWSVISAQNGVFGANVNGLKTYSYGNTPDMLCSIYKVTPSSYNDPYISANGIIWTYVGVSAIRIKDTAYSDATAFKTAVTGQKLVYELATPTTIQLTPTQVKSLLGSNNVWGDCGKSLVSYQKTWTPPDFTPEN